MFLASYNYNLERIKLYASLKGNINFALAGAVYGSHLQLVMYLLDSGATDASGCLRYVNDIKIAYILSKKSDYFHSTKFIKEIFSEESSIFYPFPIFYPNEKFEIFIDNIPMRKDNVSLREIIKKSDKDHLISYAHSYRKYELMSILIDTVKNIDMYFLDNTNFLDYLRKCDNTPNLMFAMENYLKNAHISIRKINELNECSPFSSCLARYYIRHNKTLVSSQRKDKRYKKIYKKNIKYDPVFILLVSSYKKENKLLYNVPTDVFRMINSFF